VGGSDGEVEQGSDTVAECCSVAAFGPVFVDVVGIGIDIDIGVVFVAVALVGWQGGDGSFFDHAFD
jgi:hypothetical protein